MIEHTTYDSPRRTSAQVVTLRPAPCRTPVLGWRDEPRGLAERLAAVHGGRLCGVVVTGALGEPQRAGYAFFDHGFGAAPGLATAVIDVSAAAGRTLAAAGWQRPLAASSYGVGELIRAALNGGARRIVLDCDDSAGIDGGAGMAQALGARLLDRHGWPIGYGAAELGRLARIDLSRLDTRLTQVRVEAAVQWTTRLLGAGGLAADALAGFDAQDAERLEATLERYARHVFAATGIEVSALAGSGSAGGVAAGAAALLGARLCPRSQFLPTL